ncbi:MAG TPA: adenylate/guanylate cyclase domain-containing protein, partial [Roseiarcus sp.]|nr:adenylate/guanylate cyclase domain-containing protein [Roseiarcus sp.]
MQHPMERIANWLEALGMPEYAQSFIENHVDFLVLRDLTDQDLKDLGVVLGDRRKILRAIGELDVAPVDAAESPQDVAERRQVTVLFTDLVGSTALSTRLDPEDLREVVSTYHRSVAETVRRFEGFLAKYTGDGVLVYFGYPGAHEDDADRAVLAGLEVVEAVAAAQSPIPLQARVGIATGLVVVGDLIGLGEAQERGIVGETPNLAARLLGVAQPNMVVIAEGTRQLVGNLFELQDLGTRNFKGIAGPTPVWGVLRANSVESRFEALHGADVTALVGREEECALLLRRWSRAKGGEGQVVLLSGEPGVGKSRLTAALLERLVSEPHVQLRYFCSPLHTDSSFYPVIKQIERAAGLSRGDTPKAKLDKLGARLTRTSTSAQDATLLTEMLSLANDGRYPTLDLTAEQRREGTLEALIAQLAALTRFRAVLMVLEDAHWVDPTTLEMLNRIVERIATLRVLLIVTFRPEFNSPWVGEPHVTSLTINRLARRETGLVIDRVLGDKLLPANVRRDIIERSDGIPLFVEEITKAVLEDQSREATEARAAEPTLAPARRSTSAVPASLQASLMARLDRLASAREVAQIAAVIGREFSYALLSAIAGKTDAELRSALDRLTAAGLLYRQGRPPNAVYLFKHALVQDAAYGSLLREPTRALHARIAEVLESQFAEIAESQPELVARHFSEAGLTEAAARRWGAAGHRSLARSALAEAAAQLARALELIAALPNAALLRREQIKLQVALINALFHVKGYAAPETKAAVDRARALIEEADAVGEPLEDPLSLFSVLFAAATANFVAFNGDALREQSKEFLALAEKHGTANLIMLGHRGFGTVLTWTGEFAEGRKHLDKANSLYNPAAHRSLSI